MSRPTRACRQGGRAGAGHPDRPTEAAISADVGRVEVEPGVTDHFGKRTRPAVDDRRAASHRLDRGEAEPLHQRRLHQDIGPVVEMRQVVVRDEPGEMDPLAQPASSHGRSKLRDVGVEDVAEVSDQDQPYGRSAVDAIGQTPRSAGQVLVRAQAADIEEYAVPGAIP